MIFINVLIFKAIVLILRHFIIYKMTKTKYVILIHAIIQDIIQKNILRILQNVNMVAVGLGSIKI